ncbi:vomeronasal type-2 receptor 116-like, partial [Mus pahari]|uniref:vomeronasal type-2 receptor 116-like n=1 Tax=Mus pahari TaxID=10093 RepID=UPI000A31261D
MKQLCAFNISFCLLRFSLILCCLTEPICFWRIKNSEDNDGDWQSDCCFYLTTTDEPVEENFYNLIFDLRTRARKYEFYLVMFFAIDEINKNPYLLPNVSLIFDIIGGYCQESLGSLDQEYTQMNGSISFVNYICEGDDSCVIGLTGPSWKPSLKLAIDSWTPK